MQDCSPVEQSDRDLISGRNFGRYLSRDFSRNLSRDFSRDLSRDLSRDFSRDFDLILTRKCQTRRCCVFRKS